MSRKKTYFTRFLVFSFVIISMTVSSMIMTGNSVNAETNGAIKLNKTVQHAKKMKGKSRTAFPSYFTPGRWCSDFVHWAAKKSKLNNNKVYPKTRRSVSSLISWYKKKNLYRKNTKKYTPKKGDLIFLSSSSHVGIVDKVTKKSVYIIHGNWSNKVKYTKLKRFGYTKSQRAKIKGYASVNV